MQTFKPAGADLQALVTAAKTLKKANNELSAAEKSVEAAKAEISKWLKEQRSVDLNALAIGEVIHIEGVAIIKIAEMNKFDQKAFQLVEPDLYKKWMKPIPIKRFDPQA